MKRFILVLSTVVLALLCMGALLSCTNAKEQETPTEAHRHSLGDWTTVREATCTEAGEEQRVCSACGEKETRSIPATGHTEVIIPAIPATCTASGFTEGRYCSVCGELLAVRELTLPKGHTFSDWTTVKAATCTEMGEARRVCTACGEEETEVVPATGHAFGEWTDTGEMFCPTVKICKRECSACGETESMLFRDGVGEYLNAEFPYLETGVQQNDYSLVNSGKFTILYPTTEAPEKRNEVYTEGGDSTGNRIDYAIYCRNKLAEDYFNIRFEFEPASHLAHCSEVNQKLRAAAASGDNAYQLAVASHSGDYTPLTMENGYLLNLKNLPNLDLTKAYWARGINDNAEISGAIFGVTGSISTKLYEELYVCYFNQSLLRASGVDPAIFYQAVQSGEWTLDLLIATTQTLYVDINQNEKYDEEDFYGFGMPFYASDALWSACDISAASTNKSGELKLNMDRSKLGVTLRKMNSFIWNDKGVVVLGEDAYGFDPFGKFVYEKSGAEMLGTGHVLFTFDSLSQALDGALRDSEDYGILPYPKYNKSQSKYGTGVGDHYSVYMVPYPAKNMADECGAVMEYLAYTGYHCVLPVLADEALSESSRNDPEAVGALSEVFGNIRMDAGCVFGIGTLQMMRVMLMRNSNSIDATYNEMRVVYYNVCNRITKNYAKYASNDR